MRRRGTPYSRIAEIRAGRGELLALVLVTLILGLLLGLLTSGLYDWLLARLTTVPLQRAAFWLGVVLTAGLGLAVVWLFYGRTESDPVEIELTIPYHLPAGDGGERRLTVVRQPAYQVTVHARRAVMRRFRARSPQLGEWLASWKEAQAAGQQFKEFARPLHADLTQCLLLYTLHRYGEDSLGPKAPYGWWESSLPAAEWKISGLPSPLSTNPCLLADQRPDEWKLLLPAGVALHLLAEPNSPWPRWELRHRRYGRIAVTFSPAVAVAGRRGKTYRVLTQRLWPDQRSEIHILTSRLTAQAHFRWALWKGSDPFHQWATGLLARLEEALDFGYFTRTRPDRILGDLDWKIGWVESGDSLVDTLARIEARLEELEVGDW